MIIGLFNELEKIGGLVDRAVGKVLSSAANRPLPFLGRAMMLDEAKKTDFHDAVRRGYPASWVALGMRPRE
jgi:hypothetical protein